MKTGSGRGLLAAMLSVASALQFGQRADPAQQAKISLAMSRMDGLTGLPSFNASFQGHQPGLYRRPPMWRDGIRARRYQKLEARRRQNRRAAR